MAHSEIAEAFRAWQFPQVMLEMVKRYRHYQPELEVLAASVNEVESKCAELEAWIYKY